MSSLVQKITTQALKTFSIPRRNSEFHQNFAKLKDLVGKVTASDVCFDPGLVQNREKFQPVLDEAPVTYVHIWEDELFTMGIFVLRNGSRLPLHDHPGMHGILKVLHGSMSVRSYSSLNKAVIPPDVRKHCALISGRSHSPLPVSASPCRLVDTTCETCTLSPDDGNFHEIKAVDGPTAFLDVLAPPYDHETGQRVCHYYEALATNSGSGGTSSIADNSVQYLYRVSQPSDFWCSSAGYLGPDPEPQSFHCGQDQH